MPPFLKAGDHVAIIATARKIAPEELQPALQLLTSWGLQVSLGKSLYAQHDQYAGTDEQRAQDLQWALDSPEIKAVIIARGGYGTVRIVDGINWTALLHQPKWLVGYSDITVLHNAFFQRQIPSIHGTMPINFTKHAEATESLRRALFGQLDGHTAEPFPYNKPGKAQGLLTGGNLSLLYALAATPSAVDTNDKILFIEDLDEYLYHIDRMMMQLKRSGQLSGLKGLIVGGMSDMRDNLVPFGKTAEEIIRDAVKEYDYPVCFQFPAGHVDRNLALYLGQEVSLEVMAEGSKLTFNF